MTCSPSVSLLLSATPPSDGKTILQPSCVVGSAHYLISWSSHLPLIEYAHNLPTFSATGSLWKVAWATLTRSSACNRPLAYHHRTPAPSYQPRQKGWLSSWDLPLLVESCKSQRPQCYFGPSEIEKVIGLKLPASLRIPLSMCHCLMLSPPAL